LDDALLASRAAAGDLDSFGQLYDRYFGRVYDFAWRTLGDELEAAAATEDAFGRTVGALQHPGQAPTFRALLFASAHEAVLARADSPADGRTGPAHEEAFGAFEVPDPSHVENAAVVRGDYELAALGWEAMASFTARDYALLDLHLRQGLSAHEIAHVLGTNKKEAQTILKRMTKAASEAIDSYVIARHGLCPQLREELAPFAIPPLDEEARTVAQRHVASCEVCEQEKLRLPNMFDVFAAFTAIAAPLTMKGDAWRAIAAGWRVPPATVEDTLFDDEPFGEIEKSPYGARADASGGAPPYYPRARAYGGDGAEWTRNKVMIFAAAAIGLLVFAFAGGAVITGAFGGDDGDGDAVAADPTPDTSPGISTPDAATPGGPGVVVETPTVDPNATATATEEPTSTPPPEATATLAPPPPPPPTEPPVVATPTPEPVDPNPTPTRRALIPIGTPSGQ